MKKENSYQIQWKFYDINLSIRPNEKRQLEKAERMLRSQDYEKTRELQKQKMAYDLMRLS